MYNRLTFGNGVEQYYWNCHNINYGNLKEWNKYQIAYDNLKSADYSIIKGINYTIPANTTIPIHLYSKYRYSQPSNTADRYYETYALTGSLEIIGETVSTDSRLQYLDYNSTDTSTRDQIKIYVGQAPNECNICVFSYGDDNISVLPGDYGDDFRDFRASGWYKEGFPFVRVSWYDGTQYYYYLPIDQSELRVVDVSTTGTNMRWAILGSNLAQLNGADGTIFYSGVYQQRSDYGKQMPLFYCHYKDYYTATFLENFTTLSGERYMEHELDKVFDFGKFKNLTSEDRVFVIYHYVDTTKFINQNFYNYHIDWENNYSTYTPMIEFSFDNDDCYLAHYMPLNTENQFVMNISESQGFWELSSFSNITTYTYADGVLSDPKYITYQAINKVEEPADYTGFYKIVISNRDADIIPGKFVSIVKSYNQNEYPDDGVVDKYYYIFYYLHPEIDAIPGQFIKRVYSLKSNEYPNDGVLGDYYYISLGSAIIPDTIIDNSNLVGGVSYNLNINPDNDFYYGCVASAELKFSLRFDGTDNEFYRLLEETGHPGLKHIYSVGSDTEYLSGIYNRYSIIRHKNTLDLVYYDNVIKLDKNIDDWVGTVSYPIKITKFAESLANYCDVNIVFSTSGLVNTDISITDNFTSTNMTGRQILQYICQVVGGFAFADTNGDIIVRPYRSKNISLNNTKYTSFEYEYFEIPQISKVKVAMSEDDIGVQSGFSDQSVYYIENNPLFYADSTEEIQPFVDNLYNQIKSITYTPATVKLIGDYGIKCGDIIKIDGKTFYVMDKTIEASGITLKCIGQEEREEHTTELNSQLNALRGKSNELFRDLQKTQSTLTDTRNSLQSQITQTADEIRSEVGSGILDLSTTIRQELDQIELTVSNNKSDIESKLTQTADSISTKISVQNQTITEIKQDLNGISLTYNKGEGTASITIGDITINQLVDGSYVQKQVAGIDLSGYCRFSDLSSPGDTVICGDNITTGTISADRIELTGSISWGDLSSSCQDTIASYAGADGSDAELPSYIHNTYISSTEIRSPTIYGAKIYAGTSAEGYIKLASTGMNFYSNSGGSVCGIGYYPGKYNLPYIMLGQGIDDVGTNRGMIKKYTNGIWIGDSDNVSSDSPGGTGIFINFNSGTIQKYNNGSVSTL